MVFALSGCPVYTGADKGNNPPTANPGPKQVVRSQDVVTLSGKDSFDSDGVIQSFQWKQISGPSVMMSKASNSTSQFIVPQVFTPTNLVFELTVTDDKGATGAARVTVQAVPPADPDHSLTFLNVPSSFKVVAATGAPSSQDAGQAFTITVATRVDYHVYVDGAAQARSKTYQQTASGTWPAAGSGGQSKDDYRNPWFTFSLPKVKLVDLSSDLKDNERIYGTERNALQLTESVTLRSAVATHLYVLDQAGNLVGDRAGAPDANLSFSSADGTLNNLFAQSDQNGNPIQDEENQQTAAAYYKAIDPNNDKDTLAKWKAANGFVDGDPSIVEATYINGFDLGFARHMYARKDANDNVYTYVLNAPTLDAALSNVNIIAAVAMEYSPAPGTTLSDPNKYTKFYTFVLNPVTGELDRVLSMDFDGRGEKYQPGTCASCHGGRPAKLNPDGSYPNNGNIGAGFLPWDVSTFYFSDADFEVRTHTVAPTAAQSDAFRRFNEMVLFTNPSATSKELVQGWYGVTDPTATGLPATAAFNPGFIPAGWLPGSAGGPAVNQAADAAALYQKVVGPYCRACHAQRSDNSNIDFNTYAKFANETANITSLVFDHGAMPLAAHTMDDFWLTGVPAGAASVLAAQLGLAKTRMPGSPVAAIGRAVVNGANANISGGAISVNRVNGTAAIRLNADASLFANSQSWQITAKPSGSNAVLVGDTTRDTAFLADRHGTYTVQLVVNNGVADSAPATLNINVTDNLPIAADDAAATTAGVAVTTAVLANDQLGDPPTAITSVTQGAQGRVSFDAGTTTYTPNSSATGSDSYTYTITDVDGETSTATVTMTITSLPVAANDSLTTTANTANVITVTTNDSLGTPPTSITAAINGAHGTVTHNATQTTYTPSPYYIGSDSFTYTITDSNSHSSTATVSVTVKPNKKTTFSALNSNIFTFDAIGCMSCHSGGAQTLNFTKVSSQNYTAVQSYIDTSNALNSPLLVHPTQPAPTHGGGVRPGFGNTSKQTSDCVSTTGSTTNSSDTTNCGNYNYVLEWIREGAPNN